MNSPNSANDGTVRIALDSAVAIAAPAGLRYTATPTRTPMIVDSTTHCSTMLACWYASTSTCCHLDSR